MPTKIQWSDETWNPTVGCSEVSPGCAICYAIRSAKRLAANPNEKIAAAYDGVVGRDDEGDLTWTGRVNLVEDRLDQPKRWREPRRVFVDSMSDLFHPDVPVEFIARVWRTMAACPQHQFQILTKRPKRMAEVLSRSPLFVFQDAYCERPPSRVLPNVWLGTSIELDSYAFRADHLRRAPGAVRFLSLEPLLGALPSIDLSGIDWVIAGGESGPGARPMHPEWVRGIRRRCLDSGVPLFFKQWGAWAPCSRSQATHLMQAATGNLVERESTLLTDPYGGGSGEPQDLVDRGHPGWARLARVGKERSGRELDGETWDEFPA